MARLLDKRNPDGHFPFEYRDSSRTDIRETIARAKKQIAEQKEAERRNLEERLRKTIAIRRGK